MANVIRRIDSIEHTSNGLTIDNEYFIQLPSGGDSTEPVFGSASRGMLRYNTDKNGLTLYLEDPTNASPDWVMLGLGNDLTSPQGDFAHRNGEYFYGDIKLANMADLTAAKGTGLLDSQVLGGSGDARLLLADGTEAFPSLTFVNDEVTGIYRQADDAFGLVAGGSEALRIVGGSSRDSTSVIIWGDLIVAGTTITVDTAELVVSDNIIVVNDGEIGDGVAVGIAGLQVDRGTLTDYHLIFQESDDTFRIGEVGDTQAVATRQDSPTDNGIPTWDTASRSFLTSSTFLWDGSSLSIGTSSALGIIHARPTSGVNFVVRNDTTALVLSAESNSGRDSNQPMWLEANDFKFTISGTDVVTITSGGNLVPSTDSARDLGVTATRWRTLYVDDINVTNGVDATTLDSLDSTAFLLVSNNLSEVTPSTARTNLGLVIGTHVQAYDTDLDTIASLAKTDGNFIVANGTNWVVESGSTARTSLGLGSLATLSSINDSNWSGTDLAITNGGTGASDAGTARTNLGLVAGGTGDIWVEKAGDEMTGTLTITHATPGAIGLSINNVVESSRSIRFQTSGVVRWDINVNNVAESGSNLGSNFDIYRYNDAGSILGVPFSIQRSTGFIGFGTQSPDGTLHIHTATAGTVTANTGADDLVIENSGNAGLSILTPNSSSGYILFGDPDDNDVGQIVYHHSTNQLSFVVNAADKVRITPTGLVYASIATTVSAAGTTQGAATALTEIVNRITSITASSAEAVVLPAPIAGQIIYIINDDSADTLKIFPNSGAAIDSGSTNASIDLAAGSRLQMIAMSSTYWVTFRSIYG